MSGESGLLSHQVMKNPHKTGAARWSRCAWPKSCRTNCTLSEKSSATPAAGSDISDADWMLSDTHSPQKIASPPRNKHDRTWLARLARNSCKFSRWFSHDGEMSNALSFLGGEAGSKSSNLKGLEVHRKRHTYCLVLPTPFEYVSYPLVN